MSHETDNQVSEAKAPPKRRKEKIDQEPISTMTEAQKQKRIRELWEKIKEIQGSMLRSDWHAAFESLLRIDMHRYGKRVHILCEQILGVEPPRADFIVLTEEPGLQMDKSIFSHFRERNIIEYKNPHDRLDEYVLRRTAGYGNLYISLSEHPGDIRPDQVTLTVFRSSKNRKLFNGLKKLGRLKECGKGIYIAEGYTDLPFRIIITSELEGDEYAAYRALTDRAKEEDVVRFVQDGDTESDEVKRSYIRVVLQLLFEKNPDLMEEIGRRTKAMKPKWMEILHDEIEEVAVERETQGEARGMTKGMTIGVTTTLDILDRRKQFPDETLEKTAAAVGCDVENVKQVVNRKTRKWRA